MNETFVGYAVILPGGASNAPFFAHGTFVLPSVFYKRAHAVAYKNRLKGHDLHGRVVKVEAVVREMP